MNKYFDIDLIRLGRLLLPHRFRFPIIHAIVDALAQPFVYIYDLFTKSRTENIYILHITPQVCYLEKALNDRFDSGSRRIYITDGIFYDELFLFTKPENLDEYIYLDSENADIYLFTESETGSESVDFVVNVPASLSFSDEEMKALIDKYKLASKTYKINKL